MVSPRLTGVQCLEGTALCRTPGPASQHLAQKLSGKDKNSSSEEKHKALECFESHLAHTMSTDVRRAGSAGSAGQGSKTAGQQCCGDVLSVCLSLQPAPLTAPGDPSVALCLRVTLLPGGRLTPASFPASLNSQPSEEQHHGIFSLFTKTE